MDRHFLKRMNAQKLQSSVQGSRQVQFLVNDSHHQINAQRDPDLSLHRIGARPIVMLDAQMAFDPAEEQLDAPSQVIERGHSQCGDVQVVCQKDEVPPFLLIVVTNLAQERREIGPRLWQLGFADLVAAKSRPHVHRLGALPGILQVVLGPCEKECTSLSDQMEAGEIHVAAIHDVERAGLENQLVEPKHVVLSGSSNEDTGGNRTPQIDLSVHLDSGLGLSEVCPRKKGERKIHSRRVQGINRVVDLQPQVFARVQRPGFAHERLGQILPKPPVALFVGIGESGFGNRLPEAQMVAGSRSRIQAVGNVAQSFPPSQLSESHADELLAATKMPDAGLRVVTLHQAVEGLSVDQIEELSQYKSAGIHAEKHEGNSNASHPFSFVTRSFYDCSKTLLFS